MLDCQLSVLENALARYQVEGKSPEPLGNRHPTITPFQAFEASDEFFVVAVGNDSLWSAFCSAIGRTDLANDARFLTNGLRTDNIKVLVKILEGVFVQKPAQHWLKVLEEAKVPCAPINNIEKLFDDKQLQSRNMFIDLYDNQAGLIKIAGNPIKMTNVPEVDRHDPAPGVGEHNEEVFMQLLGMDKERIARLKDEGVV